MREEAETSAFEPPKPKVVGRSAVQHAWIASFCWGVITIILATILPLYEGQQLQTGVANWWSGAILITIALGVKRQERQAAWLLIAYMALEILVRLLSHETGFLIPLVLLALAIRAAVYLQRHVPVEQAGATWVHALYELAILQAALTLAAVLWSAYLDPARTREAVGFRLNYYYLLDVLIGVSLGTAAWRRHVWAGYALCLYQIGNLYWVSRRMYFEDLWVPVGMLAVYALGAYHLHRMQGSMYRRDRVILCFVVVGWLLLALPQVRNLKGPYERLDAEFGRRLQAVPGLVATLWCKSDG